MVGIIGAMGVEIELIRKQMTISETVEISGIEFSAGTLKNKEIVVAACGVGKVFAAMATEAMILRFKPNIIINTGIAGTMVPELSTGDVAVADSVVQFDMDTTCVGDPPGLISGLDIISIPVKKEVVDTILKCAERLELKSHTGTIATGDHFFKNDKAKKDYVKDKFNGIACEMEGGAIGQVCYVNKIPFGVIRAISDSVDDTDGLNYWEFKHYAAKVAAQVIELFIENYEE